jgi:hypothetical protein
MAEPTKDSKKPATPVQPTTAPQETPDMELADNVKRSRVDSARKTVQAAVEKIVPKNDKPRVQWTPDTLKRAVIAEDEKRMASAKAYGPSARKYIVAPAVRAALIGLGPAASGVDVNDLVKRVCKPTHFAGFCYDKRGIRRSRVLPLDKAIAYTIGSMFTGAEDWLVKAWIENPNISSVLIAVAAIGSTVESLVSEQRAQASKVQPLQTEEKTEVPTEVASD